jgi:hypothetical protein
VLDAILKEQIAAIADAKSGKAPSGS